LHGTAASRGQTPEAEAKRIMVCPARMDPATMKLAAIRKAKRHVGARRPKASSPARQSKAAKGIKIP